MLGLVTIVGVFGVLGLLVFAFNQPSQDLDIPPKRYRELRDINTGKVHTERLERDGPGRPNRSA